MTTEKNPINIHEYQARAQEKLARMAYEYYAGGAHDEITLRENHDAYDRLKIRYRVCVDVAERDLRTTALGIPLSMPVMIAPTAFQRMAHPDGELATVQAANEHGTLMVLSTLSTTAVEDVAKQARGPLWFQLYIYKDRGVTRELVQRVERAGCKALVLTVDAPLWGCRERDVHNCFKLPEGLAVQNLEASGKGNLEAGYDGEGSALASYVAKMLDPGLSWKDVAWLRSITSLPILVKGLVRADDALMALEHGASGVIVSNHGGRQLDTSVATIAALPEVVEAIGGRLEVFVDGGIRRGTDVLKALALGARAVLVGRPVLWGLAAGGAAGVDGVLKILRSEFDLAMALAGCRTVEQVTRDLVVGAARG